MSKLPTEFELFKLLPPEEREQFLDMLNDLRSLGSKPTRAAALRTLLPHLQAMFGDVYDDYKGEPEVIHKKLEENK